MVCDIDFIVITGNILCSVNDIPIVKPGILLYQRSLYWGSAPYIFESKLTKKPILVLKTKKTVFHLTSKSCLEFMYQLGYGTDDNSLVKTDFSFEDKNSVSLMAYIFSCNKCVLKRFIAD